ncbi:uncharacterized protein LOC111275856 isoform X4 [Durio zibethinus]|uniref:Uncharacterized protein LOC111275856 isoform X4 n=1 Tax=Durio zibethinus TaxID=66656 RepID=A0A6P5WMZ8_DURZI|nr:uncharacterized protein LOC111275856 isoform X4 [Durio zibethinus]
MVLSIKFNAHLDVGFCCLLIPHFLYRTSWLNLLVQSTRLNLLSFYVNKKAASVSSSSFQTQEVADIRNQRNVNEEDILNKLQLFKQFDTVEDFSDHHYASSGASTKQPLKNLKRNLPDMKRTVCIPSIIFRMEKLVHALLIQAQKLKLDVEMTFLELNTILRVFKICVPIVLIILMHSLYRKFPFLPSNCWTDTPSSLHRQSSSGG